MEKNFRPKEHHTQKEIIPQNVRNVCATRKMLRRALFRAVFWSRPGPGGNWATFFHSLMNEKNTGVNGMRAIRKKDMGPMI